VSICIHQATTTSFIQPLSIHIPPSTKLVLCWNIFRPTNFLEEGYRDIGPSAIILNAFLKPFYHSYIEFCQLLDDVNGKVQRYIMKLICVSQ